MTCWSIKKNCLTERRCTCLDSLIRKQVLAEIVKEGPFEAAVLSEHEAGNDGPGGRGGMYRCFRSKRDLLECVFTRLVNPIFQVLEEN